MMSRTEIRVGSKTIVKEERGQMPELKDSTMEKALEFREAVTKDIEFLKSELKKVDSIKTELTNIKKYLSELEKKIKAGDKGGRPIKT